MKFLIIFFFVLFIGVNCVSILSEKSHRVGRIASGIPIKKGEHRELCILSIKFFQKQQTCGCFIYDKNFVITSARCVVDCTEKVAANVSVTFPFKTGKDAVLSVSKIYYPDGVTGSTDIPKYDETMEIPHTKITGSNIALLKLEKAIDFTDKNVVTAQLGPPLPTANAAVSLLADFFLYRACGVGFIDNHGNKAKGITCATVNPIGDYNGPCKVLGGTGTFTPPDDVYCVQWSDRDNNLCAGDFGGPILSYVDDNNSGNLMFQGVIGIAIGSPDVRPNAPCQDGHTVFAQYITENVQKWITSVVNPTPSLGLKTNTEKVETRWDFLIEQIKRNKLK